MLRLGGFEERWFIEVDRGTESRHTFGRLVTRVLR